MDAWETTLRRTDWHAHLEPEFTKPYWPKLREYVAAQRREYEDRIYPPPGLEFAALELTPLASTRVVILGQDPYHGAGQAHGLSFSVPPDIPIPRSLDNIFEKLRADLDVEPPTDGDLTPWARRGVLMLNATLTVRDGEPGSHRGRGWARFTTAVLRAVSSKQDPVVFMLWGTDARRKRSLVDRPPHRVLESTHPSPRSAHRGAASFMNSHPFADAGLEPSIWAS